MFMFCAGVFGKKKAGHYKPLARSSDVAVKVSLLLSVCSLIFREISYRSFKVTPLCGRTLPLSDTPVGQKFISQRRTQASPADHRKSETSSRCAMMCNIRQNDAVGVSVFEWLLLPTGVYLAQVPPTPSPVGLTFTQHSATYRGRRPRRTRSRSTGDRRCTSNRCPCIGTWRHPPTNGKKGHFDVQERSSGSGARVELSSAVNATPKLRPCARALPKHHSWRK